MAVVALASVIGFAEQTDFTFRVELDIVAGVNNRSGVLSDFFGPNDSAAHINRVLLEFVKNFILQEWGITVALSDTVKLLRPIQEAVFTQSLGRRPGRLMGW